MALTDTVIRNAKPDNKPFKMVDGKGMFLYVVPTGGKLWRLKYRFDGKEKLLSLGAYPDISLKDARARRDEARKLSTVPDGQQVILGGRLSAWRMSFFHGLVVSR